jgi:predicted MPP superfamily phosphohydrolase
MPTDQITRRDILRAGVATGVMLAAPQLCAAADVKIIQTTPPRDGKPFRIAHLTDMHVTERNNAQAGFAAALQSLKQIDPPPQFLITGGDHVMDALAQTRERTVEQWDMYGKILADNTRLKTYPCIGNHDVWGWSAKTDYSAEKDFGKPIALERLGMKDRFYSFDAGGWHFVILDNIQLRNKGYFATLDDEQHAWLEKDLEKNMAGQRLPVLVATHIPLCAVASMFFGKGGENGQDFLRINDNMMHHDAKPLIRILAKNNVKLALSGHTHMLDRVDYLGISFVCGGAISGNWWGGPYQDFQEGYGVFDLYPNGTFEHRYVDYGWKSVKETT